MSGNLDLIPYWTRRYESLVRLELDLDEEVAALRSAGVDPAGEVEMLADRRAALEAETAALLERIAGTPATSFAGLEAKLRLSLADDAIDELVERGAIVDMMPVHVLRDLEKLSAGAAR